MVFPLVVAGALLLEGGCSSSKGSIGTQPPDGGQDSGKSVATSGGKVPRKVEGRPSEVRPGSLIMETTLDSEGQRVPFQTLNPAHIESTIHTIAERDGQTRLHFDVVVGEGLLGEETQLRLTPVLNILGRRVPLDGILISGEKFRQRQMRGYERYNAFLEGISRDSTRFIDIAQLEVFLKRNLPEVYNYRRDTSFVTDEKFRSAFGVNGPEAVEHYTLFYRVRHNRWKIGQKDKLFAKWVPYPILSEGLRLDSVIHDPLKGVIYRYSHALDMTRGLRKVSLTLDGEKTTIKGERSALPPTDTLTFYISSLSSLLRKEERYIHRDTISPDIVMTSSFDVRFAQGDGKINPALGRNREELGRIKESFMDVIQEEGLVLDSVIVRASCSPEGSYKFNASLSERRSSSTAEYFSMFLEQTSSPGKNYKVISRCDPEDWTALDSLVEGDRNLSATQKEEYRMAALLSDPDRREAALGRTSGYSYIKDALYPRLRRVNFDFHLHRKGSEVSDGHPAILDSVYHRGLLALQEKDYAEARLLLTPYGDYNAALALYATGGDFAALDILREIDDGRKDSPRADEQYLMALIYGKAEGVGSTRSLEHYRRACELDPFYLDRGKVDPEITSSLADVPRIIEGEGTTILSQLTNF